MEANIHKAIGSELSALKKKITAQVIVSVKLYYGLSFP